MGSLVLITNKLVLFKICLSAFPYVFVILQ